MSASWYDVLGVAPDATHDEIRSAWRDATADLEPTDRRFDLYNQAAKVLLDPEARADYDRELVPATDEPGGAPDADGSETSGAGGAEMPDGPDPESAESPDAGGAESPDAGEEAAPTTGATGQRRALPDVPAWLLVALALAVVVVGAVAGYLRLREDDATSSPHDDAVREAQAVLEQSFGSVLTYSWDDLETAHQRAAALLTPRYQCEFDRVWALVEEQAESVQAEVRTDVVRSGVTRVDDDGDRVELVALIRNQVSNKAGDQGVGSLLLGVTMVERDGSWLVDEVDGLEGGDAAEESDPCASGSPSASPSDSPDE